MKILRLEKNPINIQKCLLPHCDFLRENFGCHCLISTSSPDYKLIVKIGLCETKNIDALFVDDSVYKFSSLKKMTKASCLGDISLKDFTVIKKPSAAKFVKVTVVFEDVFDVPKHRNSVKLNGVVRDILKMFAFCINSSVILDSLPKCQRFGIYCLNVIDVTNASADQVYEINSNTEIIIDKCISQLKLEQAQKDSNQLQVGGCGRTFSALKESIEFSKSFDKQKSLKFLRKLLLIGPTGCGKKLLIHNLAHECNCILLRISPMDINSLATNDSEKKLTELFEKAKILVESKECCIILIENIDMMTAGKTSYSRRFVSHFINLLEGIEDLPGIIVIATTNCPEEVDLQLRKPKRLEDELEIMIPTEEEREEIISNILLHYKIECDVHLVKQLARWTPGFVGADLQLAVMEALSIFRKKDSCDCFGGNPLQESFKEALKKVMPSALKGAIGFCTAQDTTFSQIGGLDNIKKTLDLSVRQQLLNPEKFHRFGIPLTKGILLYGPPGCAKTTLVKALAKECNTTFLATSAADLYSPFVGDAEKKIVQLFTQARMGSPSIIFIDEIDAVVGSKSGDRERGVQERILSTLLVEMDGVGIKVNTQRDSSLSLLEEEYLENADKMSSTKPINNGVIVIGATNRPQLLDDALKRPGRFDSLLYIPPPDELERFRILKKLTEKMSLHKSVDLELLAKLTNYYSGADLKNLCQESGLLALKLSNMSAEFVHQSHFEHIIKDYKPSLNEKIVNFYESFRKYNV